MPAQLSAVVDSVLQLGDNISVKFGTDTMHIVKPTKDKQNMRSIKFPYGAMDFIAENGASFLFQPLNYLLNNDEYWQMSIETFGRTQCLVVVHYVRPAPQLQHERNR